MYAIIVTGGKQYKVEAGESVFIEKLDVEAGDEVTFDKVVAVGKDDGIVVGAPYVEGATVTAKVEKNGKAEVAIAKETLRLAEYRAKQAPNSDADNDRLA